MTILSSKQPRIVSPKSTEASNIWEKWFVSEIQDNISATLFGPKTMNNIQIEEKVKKGILYIKNLLDSGKIDKQESEFLFRLLVAGLVNARIGRMIEKPKFRNIGKKQLFSLLRATI
jgi:hypothetical protein